MKIVTASILVIIPWLACLADDSITASTQSLISKPLEISITEAVTLAQAYARQRKVNLSEQHINSATLRYDEGKYATGRYWSIRWSWNMARIGAEYGLRIYMNKRIVEEINGP